MSGTDGDGYRSAWRADRARDTPVGDPWAVPMSHSTAPDAASAGAAVSAEPSSLEPPTAPWPFVTSRLAFPRAGLSPFSPADEIPVAGEARDIAELPVSAGRPVAAEVLAAADALSPQWPGDLGEPVPPAVWPPADLPHESAPGVWTPPPTRGTPAPTVSPVVSLAWPQSMASEATGYGPGGGARGRGTRPSGRRGVIALIAVVVLSVVVLSVVGVAIGARSHGRAKTATGSAASRPDSASPRAVPSDSISIGSTVGSVPLGSVPLGDGPVLIQKIVPAPTGAHEYDVGGSSAGVMDIEQYARHYFNGDAAELDRLRTEGFQVAASTDYVRLDGIEVTTHLVQFSNATGAEDYFEVEKSAWIADDRVTASFEVPATPDAVGYELSNVDSLGKRRTVMYEHVENVVVAVNIYTSHEIDQAVDVKVLRAQLAALS